MSSSASVNPITLTTPLKAHPGRITDEELEREDGGSGLRYTFSVDGGSNAQELGVDAVTGRVLENSSD
jgi:uncharacterized membrane protein YkoI